MHPSRYDLAAPSYDWTFRLLSLGLGPSLHGLVARAAQLQAGETVVDLGCGTGLLLPRLAGQVGQQGMAIGVDSSRRMLERASARVTRAGLGNVELHCRDMVGYMPPRPVDVVVFCLSLSTVADPAAALRRAVGFTRPGGRVVILDALLARGRWYHHAVNVYTGLKAVVVGSKTGIGIEAAAARLLTEVRVSTVYAGLYTLVVGTTRVARAHVSAPVDGQPVLLYPARDAFALWGAPPYDRDALAALLGATRAAVLVAATCGATTSQLAERLKISVPSVSQHLTALRDAGLVRSTRRGRAVHHDLTNLGVRLLLGSGGFSDA